MRLLRRKKKPMEDQDLDQLEKEIDEELENSDDDEEDAEDTDLSGVMYKGYDLKWLEKETEHPDHYLVQEYINSKK